MQITISQSSTGLFFTLMLICAVPLSAAAAEQAPQTDNHPIVVKYTPTLSLPQLQQRPDSAMVELSDGRRINLGDVRRITRTAQKARSNPPGSLLPAELKTKPAAAGGIPLRTRTDLDQALQRPDTDTVVLPSGKRLTVGMLKMLQPQVEEQRKKLPPAGLQQRPDRTGPAIRVSTRTDWYAILQKPDTTLLETAHGKRITVGELKQVMASGVLRKPSPASAR